MTKLTTKQASKLLHGLLQWAYNHDALDEIAIFINDTRYSTTPHIDHDMISSAHIHNNEDGTPIDVPLYIYHGIHASNYNEYANDNTFTIIFDGSPLYNVMNYDGFIEAEESLNKLLEPYHMYMEMCDTWALTGGEL